MSSAAQRIEEARQEPLSEVEQAFFGIDDILVKPSGHIRVGISPAVSEAALRTVLHNHPDIPDDIPELVDDIINAARQITPVDIRVHPDVRQRLVKVLFTDPRFNGMYDNGMGYSEFITRALNALGCDQ